MNRFDADFSYTVVGDVLKIWDLDLGNRSVTNDAENVLAKIEASEGRSFAGSKIMYRDSMGFWDCLAWDGQDVRFIPLRETSERLAFQKLLKGKSMDPLHVYYDLARIFAHRGSAAKVLTAQEKSQL